MKFITRIIASFVLALGGFFAMFLFARSSLNVSLLTALGTFIFFMILSSSFLDKIMKEDDERNRERKERNRELREIQERTHAEETGRLRAQENYKKEEEARKDPYGIHAMADRLRKGKRGI